MALAEIVDGLSEVSCDVLVIGGGTAGPMAALKAKQKNPKANVVLLEKANVKRSGAISMGTIPSGTAPAAWAAMVLAARRFGPCSPCCSLDRPFHGVKQLRSDHVSATAIANGQTGLRRFARCPQPLGIPLTRPLSALLSGGAGRESPPLTRGGERLFSQLWLLSCTGASVGVSKISFC